MAKPTKRSPTAPEAPNKPPPDLYRILITCRDEPEQVRLLAEFLKRELKCRALIS